MKHLVERGLGMRLEVGSDGVLCLVRPLQIVRARFGAYSALTRIEKLGPLRARHSFRSDVAGEPQGRPLRLKELDGPGSIEIANEIVVHVSYEADINRSR